jgi:hypothetical protein
VQTANVSELARLLARAHVVAEAGPFDTMS